jgi:mannitol operon transcriptional antiterminator
MYISARERKILDLLLAHEQGMTVSELAKELNVSNRTVHRDLKGVERILKEFHLELIKKSGFGIQIDGDEHNKKELQMYLFHLSQTEYTPEERQTIVLINLLESTEPVKLLSLASDLNVTVATVSHDLDKISETIEKYGLSLIRKRGYGVEIEGSESAKRRMMSELLLQHFGEYEILSIMKETIQKRSTETLNTVTEKLLGLVDQKTLLTIEKQIDEIQEELPFTIADSSYVALVVHLALAVERISQGESINFDPQYLQTIRGTKEFETAEKIARSLERAFHITIPEEEIGYITMHLMGAKLRDRQGYMLEEASFEVGIKAQELIRFVSDELNVDLTKNDPLFQDLVVHLKPAIYRIEHNMGIANPLLSKIVQDYPELFSMLEKGVKKVFPDLTVPKEEIGYLVLHFASALLRERKGIHALVICSSGLGTAKILATRLKKEIPDIVRIQHTSVLELKDVDTDQYDLIVSTVPIQNFKGPYFVVSPILQDTEISTIKKFLEKRKAEAPKVQDHQRLEGTTNVVEKISSVQKMSETIVHILKGFTLQELEADSVQEALAEACHQLYQKGVIRDQEQVLTHLLNREKIGGLGIPDTPFALYHTRSSAIPVPSFTIYTLTKWQTVTGMHQEEMKVNTILLMLAPESAPQEMLAVLSHISSLIIKDDESKAIFSSGSYEKIYSFLCHQLEKYFYEQIQHHKE